MKIKSNYALALSSAFLLWLAWPPIPYTTPLLLVALVPLFIAISRIMSEPDPKKGKQVFLTAGLTFLVWNTACIYWVYNAISAYNNPVVALLVSLIPYGLGALLMTFAFWLFYRLKLVTASPKLAYFGLVSFWVSMEYLHASWDLAFPWMTLGNGLAGMHQLAQWYETTGVYGGSVWIILSNILAFEAWKSYQQNTGYLKIRTGLGWLLLVLIPVGISLAKYYNYQEKPMPVNVVVVQPNIDPYEKMGGMSTANQLDILTKLSDSVAQVNTEYFIWPETALPSYVDEEKIRDSREFHSLQQFLNRYKNGTLITGMETMRFYNEQKTISSSLDPNSGRYYDHFNTAVQLENSPNVQFYHKSKLVPGVEKMPFPKLLSFLSPVFAGLGGTVSGWGWQDDPGVFYSQSGVGVSPVICYESLWGSWIGQSVKDGAQLIAIITNDGWWGNTSGKDQHFLYAKLRAIETRRWVVRSANTGISGFIDQRGDVVKQSGWWKRDALKMDVNLNDQLTFYTKSGDIIAQLLSLCGIGLALLIPLKAFSRKKA
ncbi:apolipoprotein N-acyltransferase [Pedobacter antarcticus]|uniref:apolipoprotein N-acyltransferase n=1 Tax=Pedobacter antarcticus TaxID=34086 RepID=UPI00087F39CC|nr:apolipoprotein N-acyltransferase [Pedobacter antarcticus]SDL99995.1 Apolipoprotein N-acyltransferase [Pedobacter antarcticus]